MKVSLTATLSKLKVIGEAMYLMRYETDKGTWDHDEAFAAGRLHMVSPRFARHNDRWRV